jgi:CHAT domain-containing protein
LQAERFRTAYLGDRQAIHESFVVQALEVGDAAARAEAFATIERAKSRSLLDVVGGALDFAAAAKAAPNSGEAALLNELARLRGELNWLYGRFGDGQAHEEAAAPAADRQRAIAERERRLDTVRDRLAVGRGIGGLYATPVDLAGAARLVPDGAALVEYFVADGRLLAFVVGGGRTEVFRNLARLAQLSEQVRRVHFQIGRAVVSDAIARAGPRRDRLLTDARRELGALHDLILAPLRPALAGVGRLIVVPHGPLHAVPFHALWDGGRSVIEDWEVQTVPSASLLERLGDGIPYGARDDDQALVVGVPDDLAPRIGREAAELAARLGGRLVLGADATVDRVTRAVSTADVVHLACHGRFSVEHPLASGLKLADRWLTVRDIYALRLRAKLVTLSACDTGRIVVGGGDELVGLVRGFFAAGAASLLLSLWLVNDECAALQMRLFYDGWRAGASKAAALRQAQLAIMSERPHPAFWAPFVLGGNP